MRVKVPEGCAEGTRIRRGVGRNLGAPPSQGDLPYLGAPPSQGDLPYLGAPPSQGDLPYLGAPLNQGDCRTWVSRRHVRGG